MRRNYLGGYDIDNIYIACERGQRTHIYTSWSFVPYVNLFQIKFSGVPSLPWHIFAGKYEKHKISGIIFLTNSYMQIVQLLGVDLDQVVCHDIILKKLSLKSFKFDLIFKIVFLVGHLII